MKSAIESPPAFAADFIISAAKASQFPVDELPEIALLGRSNAGKSSLLNRFLGRKALARVGQTPGRTRQINFFKVLWTKDHPPFLLADLPGYGFAAAPKNMVASWRDLVGQYLEGQRPIKCALLIMDIRRDLQDEEENILAWLDGLGIPARLVATKADKLSANQRAGRLREFKNKGLQRPPLVFSASSGFGREELIDSVLADLF